MPSSSTNRIATRLSIAAFVSLLALPPTACSSGGGDGDPGDPGPTPPPAASFQLALGTDKLPVMTGTTATLELTLSRAGAFGGAVSLSLDGLPGGVTAAFTPATIPAGETRGTLTLTAPPSAPHALPTPVSVRGAADGKQSEKTVTVTVFGPPGSVDTSFAGGKAIVPAGASDDYAHAMAVQPDGKILVAGRAAEHLGDFAIVRLDRDGAIDPTFGAAGKVLTDFAGGGDTAYAIAVQGDGRIVVAGTATSAGSGQDFAVARYLPDGALDPSFGSAGKVTTALGPDSDTAFAVLIQTDGKILLGGDSGQGSSTTGVDFALARYLPDGTLDAGFGAGGKVVTSLAAFGGRDSIYSLALQTVGGEARIVAAGGEGDFSVARYLPNGTLDATFGAAGTGKVTALMGSTIGAARAVRIAADGKIVIAGHSHHDFALVRLTAAGQLDASFGSAATPGKVVTAVQASNWDEAQGLAIDGDGKIVVAGWAYEGNSSAGNFAVVRYQADGVLDPTFGGTGMVVTPVAEGTRADQASAVLLQADERVPAVRVLVAGHANGSNSDFAVTRYWR